MEGPRVACRNSQKISSQQVREGLSPFVLLLFKITYRRLLGNSFDLGQKRAEIRNRKKLGEKGDSDDLEQKRAGPGFGSMVRKIGMGMGGKKKLEKK